MTEVNSYLDDIRQRILTELNKARFSISVASAYFTDDILASKLSEKANAGLSVDLIISSHEVNDISSYIFDSLRSSGVNVYKTGSGSSPYGGEMHNKFCVLDFETVITGSYNWTKRAANNEENIVIFKDKVQANEYLQKFYSLRKSGGLFSIFSDEIEINLSVDSNIAEKGETVKLTWRVTNADDIEINLIGKVEKGGETEITINDDTIILVEAKNETTEKKKIKSFLVKLSRHPEIEFAISTSFILRSQQATISWKVQHAETISIAPAIGTVESEGTKTINPFESTTYTLIAKGLKKEISKSVSLNVYPTPVLERLLIPTPSNIRLEASFEKSRVEVPSIFNLSRIECFAFNFPKIQKIKSEFIPNQPTLRKAKEVFGISSKTLRENNINELKPFARRLYQFKTNTFNGLEKVFKRNPKMTDIIKTIRKHYE